VFKKSIIFFKNLNGDEILLFRSSVIEVIFLCKLKMWKIFEIEFGTLNKKKNITMSPFMFYIDE